MSYSSAPGTPLERLARRLSTPRAIGITIPTLVLITGFLVGVAGRGALGTTVDVFAEARLGDQAAALVSYLDQSLSHVDPVLTGLERSMREGMDDVELALSSRLIDRPWLRWLALRLENGHAVGAAGLPGGGYEFALHRVDGSEHYWRVEPDGRRVVTTHSDRLPLAADSPAWRAVRSDHADWYWTETMADSSGRSLIIGRIHHSQLNGHDLTASAGIDLRLLPGLQRSDVLAEGMVAVALLDEQGRVLLERDRVPIPEQADFGLADPALRAAAAQGMDATLQESRVLDVAGQPVRALVRRLPALTGSELTVVAVADEAELRRPAAGYLVNSILIKLAATAVAVAVATLYATRVVRARRQLRAERQRAEAAELLADELGAYRLTHLVGKGGMGEVWAAEHRLLARPAAVKLISNLDGHESERIRERFMREARMTAALRSPHTVQLYDYGTTTDGRSYYAMELLEGIDLESLVLNHGAVDPSRVVSILIQICDSLAEAHDHGMVHRDIKPSNVLLCRIADHCDYVKVLDFGIVALRHAPDDGDNEHGQQLTAGTPGFMAPEQAAGEPLDGRADLYAVGCIAWWLLTGRPVFPMTGGSDAIIDRHAADPLPPLRSREVIPFVLEDLIRRCLAKEPCGRPADARSFGRALKACYHLMEPWTGDEARAWWEEHLPHGPDSPPTRAKGETPQPLSPGFADTRTQTLIVSSFAWRSSHPRAGRRAYTPTH